MNIGKLFAFILILAVGLMSLSHFAPGSTFTAAQAAAPHNDVPPPHLLYLPLSVKDHQCPNYFDDFQNPASGWVVDDDSLMKTEYVNGEYRILGKSTEYIYLVQSPTCMRQNYTVEVEARWEGEPGNIYGLLFSLNGNFYEFYEFGIITDSQEYYVGYSNGDSFDEIYPITYSSAILPGTAKNHLKVTRSGNQIILEINGTQVNTLSTAQMSNLSNVGIFNMPYANIPNADTRFDNFRVTTLADTQVTAAGMANAAAEAGSAAEVQKAVHPRENGPR